MKKILCKLLCLAFLPTVTLAQSFIYQEELEKALSHKVTGQIADSLVWKSNSPLLWFYNASADVAPYPLKGMLHQSIYRDNIDKLFADTSQKVNFLACLISAATKDTSRVADVERILIKNKYKDVFIAKSLLMLNPKAILPVAKCIKAYDFNEIVQYLTIDFLNIDHSTLQKFAQDSILSEDLAMQYLSVKAMSAITPNKANESLLRKSVVKYDTAMKGWPLAVLARYKSSNIYELVSPYLNHPQLREVSLRALAASDNAEDRKQFLNILPKVEPDRDVLNILLKSHREADIKKWLLYFKDGLFPEDYYFDYNTNLNKQEYFDMIKLIIETNKNASQLYSLMKYFKQVSTEEKKFFLEKCLTHPIEGVRERAKDYLKK